jgi:hypothetical protein
LLRQICGKHVTDNRICVVGVVLIIWKSFTYLLVILVFSAAATLAQAQNGSNNGNGNSGTGTGNGNGAGSGNSTSSTASVRQRLQAPAIAAPGLAAAGIEACLGSVSVGGSGAGFGLTIGSTTLDKGCNIRLYARTLLAMGYKEAATQMLCYDADVAGALAAQGIQCRVGPMATGVAGVQQPAQRTLTAQSADSAPPRRKKCRNYDIFFGCRDPD